MKRYVVIAGETSGDIYGSSLLKTLKKKHGGEEVSFWGVGGPKMLHAGLFPLENINNLSVVGFTEALKKAPYLLKLISRLANFINEIRPVNLILIDFPGFNLRLAKKVKIMSRGKINISYFISPQIWAWNEKRAFLIKKYIDQMLVIFPFEKSFYKKFDVDVLYVGHPFLDSWVPSNKLDLKISLGVNNKKTLVGIFPGSRLSELKRHLPIYIKTANKMIETNPHVEFTLGLAPGFDPEKIKKSYNLSNIKVVSGKSIQLLECCDLAVVTSGTISLQAAFMGIPCVVGYKLSWLSWLISKLLVNVKHISMINIILEKEVYPELIQYNLTVSNILESIENMLINNGILQFLLDQTIK